MFRSAYAATPHISFQRIDGSYHFVMLDQPAKFERAVIDFLHPRNTGDPADKAFR